jgi:hypothetical protein
MLSQRRVNAEMGTANFDQQIYVEFLWSDSSQAETTQNDSKPWNICVNRRESLKKNIK